MKEKFLWFVAISFLFVLVFAALFAGFYLAGEVVDYQIYRLTYLTLKLLVVLSILTFGLALFIRKGHVQWLKANEGERK